LHYMLSVVTIFNTRGGLLSMYLDTKVFNFRAQYPAAQIINLHRPQTWRQLDNMGFQIQISQGFGCLQTQQTTANHYAGFYIQAGCTNRIQILNDAVNKTVLTIIARDWRHKRIRALNENPAFNTQHINLAGDDGFIALIKFNRFSIKSQINAIGIGKPKTTQAQN